MEERLQNMSPEEREQFMQRRGRRGGGRPAEGAPENP